MKLYNSLYGYIQLVVWMDTKLQERLAQGEALKGFTYIKVYGELVAIWWIVARNEAIKGVIRFVSVLAVKSVKTEMTYNIEQLFYFVEQYYANCIRYYV